jgi:putative ABC transport system permease protein
MFLSFLKSAYRNFARNKVISIINVLGLSIAVGCATVIYLFVNLNFTLDKFHENGDRIFMVESEIERSDELLVFGDSPLPLGQALRDDFPQVESTVRILSKTVTVEAESRKFDEHVYFTDSEFFDIFTFPITSGNDKSLYDSNSAIITKSYAKKYFGDAPALGQQLTITIGDTLTETFTVNGIAADITSESSFRNYIFLPIQKLESLGLIESDDWSKWVSATFILLKDPADFNLLEDKMSKYTHIQNESNDNYPIRSFSLDPISNIAKSKSELQSGISRGNDNEAVITLGIMGIVLLLLACINFANNTTVTMSKRFKEIGVRKVIGGSRKLIAIQFLSENIIICLFALILGILLAVSVLLPAWERVLDVNMNTNFMSSTGIWIYMAVMLITTGVLTGAYPAFFVSRFKPVHIFRNHVVIGGQSLFIKILMTIQFVVTFLAIVFSLALVENGIYMRGQDWGYDFNRTLVVPISDEQDFTLLKNAIGDNPNIESIAGTFNHIGRGAVSNEITVNENKHSVTRFNIGAGYLETAGLRLMNGRTFNQNNMDDVDKSIVVNEAFLKLTSIENIYEDEVVVDNNVYSIVGVIEDAYEYGFDDHIYPRMFFLSEKTEGFSYLVARIKEGSLVETSEFVEEKWATINPEKVYPGYFQEREIEEFFDNYQLGTRFLSFPVVMALLLTAMGIFGLVSANISNRRKEISIRKILGASIANIAKVVSKQLIWIISIASLIAVVPSYLVANLFLETLFSVHSTPSLLIMVFALFVVIGSAILPLTTQIYRAATMNPTDSIRN